MRLRAVELGDVQVYERLRCDPVMMAELGGPQRREDMAARVTRHVEATAAGEMWIFMIVPDETVPAVVAGTVTLYSGTDEAVPVSEIGWMVLPEFQGRGLGKAAVHGLLQQAAREDRWGTVHARTSVSNAPSNGICRSLGFTFLGEQDVVYRGRTFRSNHWQIDPHACEPTEHLERFNGS